jgi:hypothetical protein
MTNNSFAGLESKPDVDMALQRLEAWFNRQILDRPPVRFAAHNSSFVASPHLSNRDWPDLKARWFDSEYQVDLFMDSIRGCAFHGETFPVFPPNLGPNVYAAYYGAELDFGDVTSWVRHCVDDWDDIKKLKFSRENPYFQKIEELTRVALQKAEGKFLVGYTDLHGSLDCVADWRNPQQLCLDLFDDPERVHEMVDLANQNFLPVFDHYDTVLKAHGQLSVNWMGVPCRGRLHIPSCDFTSMISTRDFDEFYLPTLKEEVKAMTHNIFHVDGKGMLRHLDRIMELPEIQAIQWVQGVGDDLPIMQWLPVIKKIQAAGKSVIVDLQPSELEGFIAATKPEGILLCISAPQDIQPAILKRVEKW